MVHRTFRRWPSAMGTMIGSKCTICGKQYRFHKGSALACPAGKRRNGEYTEVHQFNTFQAKPAKPRSSRLSPVAKRGGSEKRKSWQGHLKEHGILEKYGAEAIKGWLAAYYVVDGECWRWTGSTVERGYGRYTKDKITVRAHRMSYLVHKGPLKPGLVIDHVCRNKPCINPAHLRQVTARQNSLENNPGGAALNAVKTHCKHGHPLSGENLYVQKSNGFRYCRICSRRRTTAYDHALKKRIKTPCVICGKEPTDRCHIRGHRVSGNHAAWNIVCMCRSHHNQQHHRGLKWMVDTYSALAREIADRGWVFHQLPDGSWKMSNPKEVELHEARRLNVPA